MNHSGYYTGELAGTNHGGIALEIKHEGDRIYGFGKFFEPSTGGYEYDIQGVSKPQLSFFLTPRSTGQFPRSMILGRVEATVEHYTDDGKLEGRWKSSIGTEGSFWIKRENKPNIADGKLPFENSVFIVHGHDEATKEKVARLVEKLGLEPTILHEQLSKGATIIEKFLDHASKAKFAIILLTPDDVGYPIGDDTAKRPRPRQNVILELGYFVGKIGREKTAVLHKGDVEFPSDILGTAYIPIDDANAWKLALARELKGAGYDIDLNKLV